MFISKGFVNWKDAIEVFKNVKRVNAIRMLTR